MFLRCVLFVILKNNVKICHVNNLIDNLIKEYSYNIGLVHYFTAFKCSFRVFLLWILIPIYFSSLWLTSLFECWQHMDTIFSDNLKIILTMNVINQIFYAKASDFNLFVKFITYNSLMPFYNPNFWFQVLILKLNKEAPYRKDVFRAPGHQGAMKKLMHFLQTGRLINMDNFSVYTIASVLKKFLRKIPGGVFGKDIEQQFFDIIESTDVQAQRDAIHR